MSTTLVDLQSLDLRHLPDAALRVMQQAIKEEVNRRRVRSAEGWRALKEIRHRLHAGRSRDSGRITLTNLDELVASDWSDVYPRVESERKYYVYAHLNIVRGNGTKIWHEGPNLSFNMPALPFYIGKGCGNRAFDLQRNEGHGVQLRALLAQGAKPEQIVYIIQEGMTESEAFELEAKLIYFFGTKFQSGRKGLLVNLDMPKVPVTFV